MAVGLDFRVYNNGEYVAATRYAEDAAVVVGNTIDGIVKWDGRIVWREGREEKPACDFVDWAANAMHERIRTHRAERARRLVRQGG